MDAIPPHILVVDDDDKLRALLTQFLGKEGYIVSAAASAAEARAQLAVLEADLLVLDVMMPGERGTSLAKELRSGGGAPVLLLTAMAEPDDRIKGLEAGADDYLTKPFQPKELVLRINNILARTRPAGKAEPGLRFGEFLFLPESGKFTRAGEPVYLTTAEKACLAALAQAGGEPVDRETLATVGAIGNARSVDVQINRLRKKIEANPSKPVYIQTVRHAGYALVVD